MGQQGVFRQVFKSLGLAGQQASTDWRVGNNGDPILGACGGDAIVQDIGSETVRVISTYPYSQVTTNLEARARARQRQPWCA